MKQILNSPFGQLLSARGKLRLAEIMGEGLLAKGTIASQTIQRSLESPELMSSHEVIE